MTWKDFTPTIYRVDDKDFNALKVLYDNCYRMSIDQNLNVEIATLSVDKWFSDLVPLILTSVDYISNSPLFQSYFIEDGKFLTSIHETYLKEFKSFNDMKDFIKREERFDLFVLFSVCKYVNLDTLEEKWIIRYGEIIDKNSKRNKKINFLTNGIDE
jgi:hypothetical protein